MVEFREGMKQWRRMCKTYTTEDDETCCTSCPIMALEYSEHGCDAIFSDWAESADWEEVEDIIETWAAEHPEPVYPTWIEAMKMYGVVGETGYTYLEPAYKPIPADIAQKLGIEPKEG